MSEPLLFDTVTLRHFSAAGRLDVLQSRLAYRPEPHWTLAVRDELTTCASIPECADVLAASWLGDPYEVPMSELAAVFQIQVGLNEGRRPPTAHLGEAETLYVAETLDGIVVTDDNDAYDFTARRLGAHRVRDTVDLLREVVVYGELTSSEAHQIVNAIRNVGRDLRRVHPPTLPVGYFD